MSHGSRLIPAVLALSALLGAAPAVAQASDPAGHSTLHVTGHGKVFVRPDRAAVTISVRQTASGASAARNHANKRTAAIIRGIVSLGIPRADVQTSGVGLQRTTVRAGRHRRRIVYVATNDLAVQTRRLDLLSGALDVAVRDGADSFSGIDYSFSDPAAGLIAADRAALLDARRRAGAAAAQLGDQIVGVQSVDLDPSGAGSGSGTGSAPPAASAPSKGGQVPTPIEPGTQEVDADVDVVYVLGSQ